jgi:hypothetical protein
MSASKLLSSLRNKKSLNVDSIKQSIEVPLTSIGSTGHKIISGGEKAFAAMSRDAGGLSISSSFRSFSSHGMGKAGMGKKTGQLELFALRVAGVDKKDSDAAMPTHDNTGSASHMTGKALDFGKTHRSYVTNNCRSYGFTPLDSEVWHFNYDPALWARSSHNKD